MRNLLTTQNQNCYREMIEKEAYTRMAWKTKYGDDYPISFPVRSPKKVPEAPKPPTPKTVLPPVVKPPEKKKKKEVVVVEEPAEQTVKAAPLMRPVSPHTKDALYRGFSKEGKGRHMYLRTRAQKGPEEKFDFPLLSSWEYGWRLGDYDRDYRSPANGRSGIVRGTFYARNGIFHIPSPTDHLG